MATVITVAQAKVHLRITDTDHDADIGVKVDQADGIIRNYLKAQDDPTWTDTTAPKAVQAAALLMVGHLFEHRGDDMAPDESLWKAIERLLIRYRDPALA
jgi:Phage gp6-like head-tail connector protein